MLIVFAVVVFSHEVKQVPTLLSLSQSAASLPDLEFHTIVFDNSPREGSALVPGNLNCTYRWSGENRGLAKTYNEALDFCAVHGAGVLVTLDQDSLVTPQYLQCVADGAALLVDPVVALCPVIAAGGRTISPVTADVWGRRTYGVVGPGASAINSFSAYSVDFLRSIGGFDEFYWLDALDFSTYARIAGCGKRVLLLDTRVQHDLSLLSRRVSLMRLTNLAYYEGAFLLEFESALKVLSGFLRIQLRAIRLAPSGSRLTYLSAAFGPSLRGGWAGVQRRFSQFRGGARRAA